MIINDNGSKRIKENVEEWEVIVSGDSGRRIKEAILRSYVALVFYIAKVRLCCSLIRAILIFFISSSVIKRISSKETNPWARRVGIRDRMPCCRAHMFIFNLYVFTMHVVVRVRYIKFCYARKSHKLFF